MEVALVKGNATVQFPFALVAQLGGPSHLRHDIHDVTGSVDVLRVDVEVCIRVAHRSVRMVEVSFDVLFEKEVGKLLRLR